MARRRLYARPKLRRSFKRCRPRRRPRAGRAGRARVRDRDGRSCDAHVRAGERARPASTARSSAAKPAQPVAKTSPVSVTTAAPAAPTAKPKPSSDLPFNWRFEIMTRSRKSWAAVVAFGAATATATSASADRPKDARFDEANKKYVEGDYEGASEASTSRAFAGERAPGRGRRELGASPRSIAASGATPPSPRLRDQREDSGERRQVQQDPRARFEEAKSHVVTVRLHASVPTCVFTSPSKPRLEEAKDFYLEPKTEVAIVARCGDEYEEMSTSFHGEAGQFVETTVVPVRKSKRAMVAALIGAELRRRRDRRRRVHDLVEQEVERSRRRVGGDCSRTIDGDESMRSAFDRPAAEVRRHLEREPQHEHLSWAGDRIVRARRRRRDRDAGLRGLEEAEGAGERYDGALHRQPHPNGAGLGWRF